VDIPSAVHLHSYRSVTNLGVNRYNRAHRVTPSE
jgi:hypothetical protein